MAGEIDELDEQSWLYRPSFPNDWERMSLLSMARWVNGLAFRDFHFSATGKPVIKIAEIKGGITGQTKFTNQTFADSVFVTNGDMLFSWSGQPETSIDVFWWRGRDGWLNQHIFKLTPVKDLDPAFFYYILRYLKPNFVAIAKNKQTTGLGHVTRRDIENIEAAFPPLPTQRAIAHVLGTLDDLIKINRETNEILEEMARALFKSWFVDFDPVRAKLEGRPPAGMDAATAALFPDHFQDSELGQIPKGWELGKVSDLATLGRVAVNPGRHPEEFFDHYSLPAFDDGRSPKTEIGSAIMSNKFLVEPDSVLLSKLNPHIPRVWLPDLNAERRSVCSTEFMVARATAGVSREYLFSLFTDPYFASIYGTLVSGTTGSHQRISPDSFMAMQVVAPPMPLVKTFTDLVRPMFDTIHSNLHESRDLATLRDTLLPKLLSGELSAS